MSKQLKVEEKQHPELQALRKGLTSCFSDVSNFLLPHPGRHVATNPNFKGNLNQIDEEFIEHIKVKLRVCVCIFFILTYQDFMPSLLSPSNLVVKAMGGKEVKAKEIVQYYKSYMEIFKVILFTY